MSYKSEKKPDNTDGSVMLLHTFQRLSPVRDDLLAK